MLPRVLLFFVLQFVVATAFAADGDEQAIRAADARYWQAYNACDFDAMGGLLTDDIEFYHDVTGLTAGKAAVLESLRKGPCGTPAMRLRREAVAESVRFDPLAGGFGLLSGTHRFFFTEAGKPERLDGQAGFTVLWQAVDGQWRMRRVFSYAHGPAPHVPPSSHLTLAPEVLAGYAGHYAGKRITDILVAVDGEGLRLTAGDLVVTLRAETPTRFFALERNLRFEFATPPGQDGAQTLTVYENGDVAETATQVR
ncbi:MAG TPA: nuclear transport factor 2 family protein [Luteimonas sp.]|nr:nuclear transport factor 2 family protein [Luteimonas sp.]